jgi:2,4-dienoyl-CoA reductase-like NADH-dependent reductase (Old Yellow Enzyme family)
VSQRDVKNRISSVQNVRKITRAMEMVAAARLRRAEQRIEALRPYEIPIGIQLWHPGRQTLLGEPIAPSAVPLSSGYVSGATVSPSVAGSVLWGSP